jgi:hypothetical protein
MFWGGALFTFGIAWLTNDGFFAFMALLLFAAPFMATG